MSHSHPIASPESLLWLPLLLLMIRSLLRQLDSYPVVKVALELTLSLLYSLDQGWPMLLRYNKLFRVSTILCTEHHNIYAVSYLAIIPIANLTFPCIEPSTD